MTTVQLRRLADVNPATPAFDKLPADEDVTFQPLETVWADDRADCTRVCMKADVATGYVRFQSDDVLLPKTAPTFQHARTMVTQGLVNGAGAGSSELHVLRAKAEVDPRFIGYVVRSDSFIRQGVSAYQGVAGLQRVPADFVAEWPVAPLTHREQNRIADFLDEQVALLDRVINLCSRQRDLAFNRRSGSLRLKFGLEKSSIIDIVEGKTENQHGWSNRKLGTLLQKLVTGGTPSTANASYWSDDTGTAWVSISDMIERGAVVKTAKFLTPSGLAAVNLQSSPPGTVLFAMYASVGKTTVLDISAVWNQAIIGLIPGPILLSRYLLLWLELIKPILHVMARSSTQDNLNATQVNSLRIPLPNLRLQEKIINEMQAEDETAMDLNRLVFRQIALLQERKQALITAAVTGQLDVTTARSGLGVDVP